MTGPIRAMRFSSGPKVANYSVVDPAWAEQEVVRLRAENAELRTQLRDALAALSHCRERIIELGHMLGTGGK